MLGKVRHVCSAQISFDGQRSVNSTSVMLCVGNDVRFMKDIKDASCNFPKISMDDLPGLMFPENVSIPSEENVIVELSRKYLTHKGSKSISFTPF